MSLRVIQPFGGHAVGAEITAPDEVATILASEQAAFVVAVADEPDAKADPEA